MGDPLRFSRILINLLSNAIKYTDHGHIGFNASCRKLDDTRVEVHCEITDTGIGIPGNKQTSIFEKFVQADTSTTRKYGGTGLGLAITKQLVELMGGTISVESEVGKGSVFRVSIPFVTTDQLNQEKHARKNRSLAGTLPVHQARILIAEDHPLNQAFIKKIMEKFGINHFSITDNGAELLKAYKEGGGDVILMDCHMPEMNGYDATKAIRDFEKNTGQHVKIVAMTANAMLGEKEKCLRYGMDDYISKPINMDELREILGQWISFRDVYNQNKQERLSGAGAVPVDLSRLDSFTDGDKETEKELVGLFVEQSDKTIKILEEQSKSEDKTAWAEAAHKIKGGAGSIGADTLHALCDRAEHSEGAASERYELFIKIKDEYTRVRTYLKEAGLLS